MARNVFDRSAGRRRGCYLLALALVVGGGLPKQSHAYTPQSPEVRHMVENALAWLETKDDMRLGGKCLIALCFFKNGRPIDHPRIVAARVACEKATVNLEKEDNYSLGLALVFLLETDPQNNRELAQQYVDALLKKQKPNGAWTYPHTVNGDTSQTQYPTLGLWMAVQAGLDVPMDRVSKICTWLARTQDPSGAWGYHGQDPGNYQRVRQQEVRPSLAAAGLGSLYIAADLMGVHRTRNADEEQQQPSALRKIESEEERERRRSMRLEVHDAQAVRKAMADGNAWFDKNFTVNTENYLHYYLYALERYQSYREMAEGKIVAEPHWYNAGVEMLQSTQNGAGFWNGQDNTTIATTFAVLFLSRASQQTTKKSGRLGDAVLLGGMGLPPNTADLQVRDGKVVETAFAGTVDELLSVLNDPDNPELARLAQQGEVVSLTGDVTKRAGQIARLRALVSAGNYESRLVAVRTLARVRDLDNAPVLIYALTDPDMRIVLEADKGLRFLSRKFQGVGLTAEPRPDDVQAAIRAWKAWYKAIRPAGELLD